MPRAASQSALHGVAAVSAPSPRAGAARPHMTLTRAHMNPVGTARRYSASPSPSPPKTKGLVQMATHPVNTRIACGNRFRVHALADGSWRIGFTTRLGYRDFPADPATDAAFAEFYRMTTADQIDAAAGDLMARGPMTRIGCSSPPRCRQGIKMQNAL